MTSPPPASPRSFFRKALIRGSVCSIFRSALMPCNTSGPKAPQFWCSSPIPMAPWLAKKKWGSSSWFLYVNILSHGFPSSNITPVELLELGHARTSAKLSSPLPSSSNLGTTWRLAGFNGNPTWKPSLFHHVQEAKSFPNFFWGGILAAWRILRFPFLKEHLHHGEMKQKKGGSQTHQRLPRSARCRTPSWGCKTKTAHGTSGEKWWHMGGSL